LARKTRDFVKWASLWHPENRHPVLLCSLTRTAAAEIAGRDLPLPRECIGTLHSHAYRSIGCPRVAETLVDDFNRLHPAYRLSGAEIDTENPEWDRRTGTPGDEMSNEYHLLRARMVDHRIWPSRVVSFARKWERWKQDFGTIDFTDMIEIALRDVPCANGDPKIVIADEAQDLSALEYALLKKWGVASGNLILTGDPYQALYTWRGAHPEIFIDPSVPADRRRVLGQSYRVPRQVHQAAMRWVRQLSTYRPMEYLPRDHEGEVTAVNANWRAPDGILDAAEAYLAAGKSVMVQASCSFFLAPLLAAVRRRGLPFANPWRARRGDWNPLGGRGVTMARRIVDFLRADPATHGQEARSWTPQELRHWVDCLAAKGLLVHGAKQQIETLYEAAEAAITAGVDLAPEIGPMAWETLLTFFEPDPMNELLTMLNLREQADENATLEALLTWWGSRLLPTKKKASGFPIAVACRHGVPALTEPPKLHIGTIHSFKGAEADAAIIIPDLSPSGYREWNRPGEGRDGVVRLFYVALTRARESVVLCQPTTDQTANLLPLMNRED
jgi:superfamily I DNA/RNA helicase